MDDTLHEIAGPKEISESEELMNSEIFLGDHFSDLDLIRDTLNFRKQTDKLRDFRGL